MKVIDKAYLERRFYTTDHESIINEIQKKYDLNAEQEQAFKIITHHSVMPDSEQLMMYTGGMAGTGKTQVIKAVIAYFLHQHDKHCVIVV